MWKVDYLIKVFIYLILLTTFSCKTITPQAPAEAFQTVVKIQPGSPADQFLCKDDELLEIDGLPANHVISHIAGTKNYINVKVRKLFTTRDYKILADNNNYFKQFIIEKNAFATEQQKVNFSKWLKTEF